MVSPVVPQADDPGASSEQSVADPVTPGAVLSEPPLNELVAPSSAVAELAGLLREDGFGIATVADDFPSETSGEANLGEAKPSEAPLANLGEARSLAKPSETRSGEANLGEAKPSEAPLVSLGEARSLARPSETQSVEAHGVGPLVRDDDNFSGAASLEQSLSRSQKRNRGRAHRRHKCASGADKGKDGGGSDAASIVSDVSDLSVHTGGGSTKVSISASELGRLHALVATVEEQEERVAAALVEQAVVAAEAAAVREAEMEEAAAVREAEMEERFLAMFAANGAGASVGPDVDVTVNPKREAPLGASAEVGARQAVLVAGVEAKVDADRAGSKARIAALAVRREVEERAGMSARPGGGAAVSPKREPVLEKPVKLDERRTDSGAGAPVGAGVGEPGVGADVGPIAGGSCGVAAGVGVGVPVGVGEPGVGANVGPMAGGSCDVPVGVDVPVGAGAVDPVSPILRVISSAISEQMSSISEQMRLLHAQQQQDLSSHVGGLASAVRRLAMDARLGLGERLANRPGQLSGGQQQRCALARALVFEPELVLMDEPLGALDKQLREHMQYEIKHIHENLGVTVVYVTHDQEEALSMSDRIAVMSAGKVQQIGSAVDIYEFPENRFVAGFIGSPAMNLVSGSISGGTFTSKSYFHYQFRHSTSRL